MLFSCSKKLMLNDKALCNRKYWTGSWLEPEKCHCHWNCKRVAVSTWRVSGKSYHSSGHQGKQYIAQTRLCSIGKFKSPVNFFEVIVCSNNIATKVLLSKGFNKKNNSLDLPFVWIIVCSNNIAKKVLLSEMRSYDGKVLIWRQQPLNLHWNSR